MKISISMSGIAFSAMPTNHLDFNNNNTTQETSKIEDKEYSYKTSNSYGTIVEFRDPANGKSVSVSLNDNVLDRLKSHFLEEDFHKNKDGSVKLSGEAEKFVSGWFGDIAYKREFLSADKNKDGKLDSSEYLNTKNDFTAEKIATLDLRKNTLSFTGSIKESYIKPEVSDSFTTTDISKELNHTLRLDKDFDSTISLVESMRSDIKYDNLSDRATVLQDFKDALINAPINIKKLFNNILSGHNNNNKVQATHSSPKNNQEDELKKQEALMKLIQANGDASKLTAEERALLGSELQLYSKHITNELSNSLSKTLDNKINNELNEKAQIDKEKIERLKILEKLQADPTKELSKQEKEQIAPQLKEITNGDGTIDVSKLDDIMKHIKVSQIYNEKQDTQMVGRYYEIKG